MSSNWRSKDNKLAREFNFPSFTAAIAFVHQVAALAEEAQHHPRIDIVYTKVILELWTHSAGGVTAKDFDLAARIDKLAA